MVMKKQGNPMPPKGIEKPNPPPCPPKKKGGFVLLTDLKIKRSEIWVSREWLQCKKCGIVFECTGYPSDFHFCKH